jgi:predicted PurR-regulated permease PerM
MEKIPDQPPQPKAEDASKDEVFPTIEQKRVMWTALTTLAWAVILGITFGILLALYMLLKVVYPVLLPLGVAAIIAFILDPVLEWLEKHGFSRLASLLVTFSIFVAASVIFLLLVVPPLVREAGQSIKELPETFDDGRAWVIGWLHDHPEVKEYFDQSLPALGNELPKRLGEVGNYLAAPFQTVYSWVGFTIGFLFVPIYVFFLLLEKDKIRDNWREYLPLTRSWVRDELVVVLTEIHYYLAAFFRGQVVVAGIIGVLTSIGLLAIGLPYALLIGFMAGVLSFVPFLGVITSIVPALILAYVHAPDPTWQWLWPLLVIAVFTVVQTLEGTFITPKIIGDQTGLHPMTVILSILIWSLLLPGLLGPILAVPLTATLRVLMYRYVWLRAAPPDARRGASLPAASA